MEVVCEIDVVIPDQAGIGLSPSANGGYTDHAYQPAGTNIRLRFRAKLYSGEQSPDSADTK
jgi:hypothetical protein